MATAGWMLMILALPRIVRLLYPEVWVEDDFYLESAYLVSIGMRPYLDFVHPHMPVLEWFTAGWIRLFGASHFSVEVLNEAAIYITSVLTSALAFKAGGRRTAIWAAILYAFSSLVFRYHVYERECFVGALVAGAALIALRDDLSAVKQSVVEAALLATACAVKLTAGLPAAALLIFLAVGRRRWLAAILAGFGIFAGLAILSAALYHLYGFEFVFQTFVFHFMKGRQPRASVASYPCSILDVLAPLFIIGCVRIATERRVSPALWLVLSLVGINYLFFGWLSPTAWGHNYLDFLPYIAIVAGVGVDRIIGAVGDVIEGPWRAKILPWCHLIASAGLAVICLTSFTPLINQNWLHGSVYGFGFVPKQELAALSEGLRRASAPGEPVLAPAFLCFEANRRELIRYPETYGVYRNAEEEFRKYGFSRARRRLGAMDFYDLIARTDSNWAKQIKEGIENGTVNVVVPDSLVQLLPLAVVPPDYLAAHGFAPALRTEHFVIWRRMAR